MSDMGVGEPDPVSAARPAAAPAAASGTASAAARQQVVQLAEEFEALLMTQMLRDMRRSLASEDDGGGFGAETMTDTVDVEFGRAMSRAGGVGLRDVLLRAFERQQGLTPAAAPPPTPEPTPPVAVPAVPVPGALSAPTPPPGRVTSAYGWRPDPFTGATRFHSGVDVAMAYGQDVRSVAEGRVAFAGERGGYGNLVVVQHADGHQTSYGHLSDVSVRVGDVIATGQLVGKSGTSGRSTGPHLHFEVRRDGRAVDPSSVDEWAGGRQATQESRVSADD